MQVEDAANSADRVRPLDFKDGEFLEPRVAVRGTHPETIVHGVYECLGQLYG